MDDQVLRGMARWPNVPAVFGWLALDRRGTWLLQGDPIVNPTVAAYIGRNYERDASGRWFFQNGPQRVYVDLEYTPFVYRAMNAQGAPLELESHTGVRVNALSAACIDENGTLLVESEHGLGVVHDRDLESTLTSLIDAAGKEPDDVAVEQALARLQRGLDAPVWMRLHGSNVRLEPVNSGAAAERFGYVPRPAELPGDKSSAGGG